MGELCKPPQEQAVPNIELLREEAAVVWQEYATLREKGEVKHY